MPYKTDEELLDELLELYADKIQPESLHSLYRKEIGPLFEAAKKAVLARMKGEQNA